MKNHEGRLRDMPHSTFENLPGTVVSEAGIAISDMSIFSVSVLSINTLALVWFHLVQKEEYSNHIGYAMYFEYSFSNLHLPYWHLNASCNLSHWQADPCFHYHYVFKYSAWKCFYLVFHSPRSGMALDLQQDSNSVITSLTSEKLKVHYKLY